jgi:pimeloyl-ACP methyl ester carboxylesterase
MSVEQFRVQTSESVLTDLRQRLERTRFPDSPAGIGWRLGVDPTYMKVLVEYWLQEFDWAAVEKRLNSFPQFRTTVEGVPIHFVHVRSGEPDAVPLVLTHGWPSTFAELLPLAPGLSDPTSHGGQARDAFDLVIPSLPGFGFSAPYTRLGPRRVHDLWAGLMTQLGYQRFGACGGDVGARVTSRLGWYHPDRVVGIHLSTVDLEWPHPLPDDLSAEEKSYVARTERWEREEGAYATIQATKPQTLAYGLADSPAGLAGWIVEKFYGWSDCDGDITTRFSFDDILTTVTLYWVTNTINSANRNYYEARNDPAPLRLPPGERIEVPTGIAMFPGETDLVVPRSFADRCYRITHWTDMPRGGHFAALEEPDSLVRDIRAFFRPLRPMSLPGPAARGGD